MITVTPLLLVSVKVITSVQLPAIYMLVLTMKLTGSSNIRANLLFLYQISVT